MLRMQNVTIGRVARKVHSIFYVFVFVVLLCPCTVRAETDLNDQINVLVRKLWLQSDGVVLKATDTMVYLSAGQNYGVQPGSRFEIIQQGEPLTLGTEIIGYEESIVALIEVESVREKLSICKIIEKTGTPKKGDAAQQVHKTFKNILVSQFVFNNGYNRLTKSLQETLADAVANLSVSVVERKKLEAAMKDQKITYASLNSPKSAKKIGATLNAQGLLLGSITDMGEYITIDARILDIASGKSVGRSEVEFPKTQLIAKMLKIPVDDIGAAETPSPTLEPIPEPVLDPSFSADSKFAQNCHQS